MLFVSNALQGAAGDLSASMPDVSGDIDAGASVPSVDVNVPSVDVDAPSVDVDAPSVDVDAPSVGVDVPSTSASLDVAGEFGGQAINWLSCACGSVLALS